MDQEQRLQSKAINLFSENWKWTLSASLVMGSAVSMYLRAGSEGSNDSYRSSSVRNHKNKIYAMLAIAGTAMMGKCYYERMQVSVP